MPEAESRNHLAGQTAAYLVQHAHDPVDWHPWGSEAFDLAHSLSRPVFLSVGYASCHWCHVMQRESFRDPETARYLNEHFVAIKVDRDERPDVDHLYQQYVTMAAGSGGWPMTVFLDAVRRPLYGGTYFPKKAPYNMQSLSAVLTGVERTVREDPQRVAGVVAESTMVLADLQAPKPAPELTPDAICAIVADLATLDDREFGGLGGAPKFPGAPLMDFLLEYHRATGDVEVLDSVERWMYGMLRGGIFDQVGGGIFRYSTDETWLAPHFVKMLVDNAQLLSSIARLYRVAPSEELARAARQTAAFLARDLARPGGGYWASVDSESEGLEGAAYVWTAEELLRALDAPRLDLARRYLGATDEGNWRGKVILTRRDGREQDADAVDAVLDALLDARSERPLRVIRNATTEFNALTVRGLLEAGTALGDDALVSQGMESLEWLLEAVLRGDRVVHTVDDPAVGELDLLADYGALAVACLAAVDAGGRSELREVADRLLGRALALFEDRGGLYMTRADTDLPVRPAAYDDVPSPSGWTLTLDAARRLRPDDSARWDELFGPLLAFALHAPISAGATLTLAVDAVWPSRG